MTDTCARGHEYTPENTYVKFDRRINREVRSCRACQQIYHKNRVRTPKREPDERIVIDRDREAITLDCGHRRFFYKPHPRKGEVITCDTCWSLAGTLVPPPRKVKA